MSSLWGLKLTFVTYTQPVLTRWCLFSPSFTPESVLIMCVFIVNVMKSIRFNNYSEGDVTCIFTIAYNTLFYSIVTCVDDCDKERCVVITPVVKPIENIGPVL